PVISISTEPCAPLIEPAKVCVVPGSTKSDRLLPAASPILTLPPPLRLRIAWLNASLKSSVAPVLTVVDAKKVIPTIVLAPLSFNVRAGTTTVLVVSAANQLDRSNVPVSPVLPNCTVVLVFSVPEPVSSTFCAPAEIVPVAELTVMKLLNVPSTANC